MPYAPFVLSPDGKTLVMTDKEGKVRLWDVATGNERRRLEGHDGPVTCVGFSPDGKGLLTGSEDSTILVWDVAR